MRRLLKYFCGVAFALTVATLLKGALPHVPSGTWSASGNMAQVRAGASAVVLSDGRVLVTGGTGLAGELDSAEIFDTNGSFSAAASMSTARSKHAAVVLKDGRVLVAGGVVPGGGATNAAEIYVPTSGSWLSVPGGMLEARWGQTATLLKDGRVLIAGGVGNGTVSLSAEIYDPATNQFSFAGSLSSPRSQHAAALLQDGRVLIMGGTDGTNTFPSTNFYDPATGAVSPGPNLSTARAGHSATALLNGNVLVAGGNNGAADLGSAEIYDAAAGSFVPLAAGLAVPRRGHLAFLLPHNNTVLIVAGTSNGAALASAELYVPWGSSFRSTGAPAASRQGAVGGPLTIDGLLVLAGGNGLASSELYGFASLKTDKEDYAPGETVRITGGGWQPGETVTLVFAESPLLDAHPALTAVADARGNISNTQFSPDDHDIGVRFYLTATGATSQAQTTFTDDLPPPTVQFNASVSSDLESVTAPTTLAVSLSAASASTVTVDYAVTGGTATGDGTDYTLADGTLTFDPGDTVKNIPLTIIDDAIDELDESVVVTLSAPDNATLGGIISHTYTIEDNDPRPTAEFSVASSSGDEGSTPASLAVTLSTESGKTVTVGYSVTGGTATGGGVDYTLAAGTLIFDPGVTVLYVPLAIVDDGLHELDETVAVSISFVINGIPGDNDLHTYTIEDNDPEPTVEFALSSSGGSEASTPANLAVQLSNASSQTVTVGYAVTGGTATGGGADYTLLGSGTLTFDPSDTVKNVQLSIVNDLLDELDETVEVTLSGPVNAMLGVNTVHIYSIVDNDDAPTVQFTLLTSTGPESSTPVNIEVKLSAASGQAVTVEYASTGGTATGGGLDYTLPSGPLSFSPGVTVLNIPITVNNDLLDESDETVEVTLSGPVNATLGANTVHTYTIVDNDDAPTVQFTLTGSSGDEGSTPANLEVQLSGASGQAVMVNYAAAVGSATNPDDYTVMGSGTLTFDPGDTIQNVQLSIVDDLLDELDETVDVNLSGPVSATLGANTVHTYTIVDNDQPPTISIDDVSMSEGNSPGTTDFTFTASLSAASGQTITVKYATADNTATTADNDYVEIPATLLTFNPGETSKPVVVTVNRDNTNEADETFFVDLSDLTNLAAMGNDLQGIGTILNDDPVPTVQFTLLTSTGPESSTPVNIEVKLSAVSGQTVTVDYAPTGGTATGGGVDYSLPVGPLSFAPGITVLNLPVTVNNDLLNEDDETVEITLSAPTHATLGANTVHTYTILDNDPLPTVSIDDVTEFEGNSPGTTDFTFMVNLSAASGRIVEVKYSTANGTATTADNDYVGISATLLTFAPGETSKPVVVTVNGDNTYESGETFFVNLSDLMNLAAMGNDLQGIGTIENDDMQLTVTKMVVNDDGGTKEVGDFPLFVDGQPVTSGTPVSVSAGPHTVSETSMVGYAVIFGGDCASDGTVTLNPGDAKSCIITNDDIQAQLTVTKMVVNDNGGTKVISDFPLFVDGEPVTSGVPVFLNAGAYTVTETMMAGYAATFGGDCASDGTVTLSLGDAKSCTITNDDVQAQLTLTKLVTNNNGGTKVPGDFSLFVDGQPVVSGVPVFLNAGPHTVTETPVAGYLGTVGGHCGLDGSITLNPGDEKSCTITNDDVQPQLTLTKLVTNNNGGTKVPGDFSLFVDGQPVVSGVPVFLNAGPHTVTETPVAGYLGTVGGHCGLDGSITLNPGDEKSCTITNDDVQPQLTLTKLVTNNNGGTKVPGDFSLFVDGQPVVSGVPVFLNAGPHTVTETPVAGYLGTVGGDCALDGSITLNPGDEKSCTITNDDVQPQLTLTKLVTNNNGGTKVPGDFSLFVDGQPVVSGVPVFLNAGPHTVTETPVAGYLGTVGGHCGLDGSITLNPGDEKSCTITNDDVQPQLTLTKLVTNNNGGTKVPGDFSLFVDGQPVVSGVPVFLNAGPHTVTETPVAGYLGTVGGHCGLDGSITLNPGDEKSCTITNDDVQPQLTLTKLVTNNNGGTKVPGDFSLFVDGQPVVSGVPVFLNAGPHTVTETPVAGYLGTVGGHCGLDGSITLNPGDEKSCTITNDDVQPQLTLTKLVTNNNGGTKVPGDFSLFVDGQPVVSGVPVFLNAGPHTVTETPVAGYLGTVGGHCGLDGSITLNPGDEKSCTITNDDVQPQLTLTKLVTNNNGGTKVPGDFSLFVDGQPVVSGVPVFLNAGPHTVTETPVAGYLGTVGGHCGLDGSITLNPGDEKSCTITNDDVQPQLTLTKLVTNNNGGTKVPGDFSLFVDGQPVVSGVPVFLNAGPHTVTETPVAGYLGTVGGDCALDGSITLNPGDEKSCTITNDDVQAQLTLTKLVTNDNGGTKVPGDFSLFVDGQPVVSGVPVFLNAGPHTVTETPVAGYLGTVGGHCGLDGSITLNPGDEKSCTITNDDVVVQAQLTVVKMVVNDNGGTKQVDDFPLFVDGQPVTSGVPNFFNAGAHTVSETGSSVYAATFSGDCAPNGSVMLNPGDVKTCIITNDDIAPKLIVIKHVVNNYDGNKQASDFTMTVSGTAVPGGNTAFPGAESPGTMKVLKVGSYIVTESGPSGYTSSFSTHCSGSISLGQTKTCTVTNTAKKAPPPPPPCVTSKAGVFRNNAFALQTDPFTAEWDSTPSGNYIDSVVGLSNGAVSSYASLAVILRFNPSGFIDARNGNAYGASNSVPYTGGQTYHFRVLVDFSGHTYDAYVKPSVGAEVQIAHQFAFRTEVSTTSQLNNWSTTAEKGSQLVCNFMITTDEPPPPPPPPCIQSSTHTWLGDDFAQQAGTFVATWDATPNGNTIDSIVGLSTNAASQYEQLAVILRFYTNGRIEARNGANYGAVTPVLYTAGVAYHFRVIVNLATKRYDAYVTPSGGAEMQIASDYAFRTEQNSVSSLGHWNTFAEKGSQTVCDFTVQPAP